jgi:hypothetical protein
MLQAKDKNLLDMGGPFGENCPGGSTINSSWLRGDRGMELQATAQDTRSTHDEWELADEELDRSTQDQGRGPICSTSRPCTCSRCHCR